MDTTWILVSDARHARFFSQKVSDKTLQELADFVFPVARRSTRGSSGSHGTLPTKGHGRTGHAGTQLEPETDLHAKERSNFARQLADYLNSGVSEHQCSSIALIATEPMLHEIREHLSSAAGKMLKHCVASDLTHYSGRDLQARVQRALQFKA